MKRLTEITTPEALEGEEHFEPGLRPRRLAEFVGQGKVREALQIAVDAHQRRMTCAQMDVGGPLRACGSNQLIERHRRTNLGYQPAAAGGAASCARVLPG